MEYLLNLLGLKLDTNTEIYDSVDEKSSGVVEINEFRTNIKKYKVFNDDEEADAAARNMASIRALFLDISKNIYLKSKESGLTTEESHKKVNDFINKIYAQVLNDPRLLFFLFQSIIETYTKYLVDTKIDFDSIMSNYSKNPDAYKNPKEYEVDIYTFNKSISEEQKSLREFSKCINNNQVVNKKELEKFASRNRPLTINSLFAIDNSVMDKFYKAMCNLKEGEISLPVFQQMSGSELVSYILIKTIKKIPVESKNEQVERSMNACRFIATTMLQKQLSDLIENKKVVDNVK